MLAGLPVWEVRQLIIKQLIVLIRNLFTFNSMLQVYNVFLMLFSDKQNMSEDLVGL